MINENEEWINPKKIIKFVVYRFYEISMEVLFELKSH